MAISYGELAVIGGMTNEELKKEYEELTADNYHGDYSPEDREDTVNAILQEMESRNLPHP